VENASVYLGAKQSRRVRGGKIDIVSPAKAANELFVQFDGLDNTNSVEAEREKRGSRQVGRTGQVSASQ
jgi:hypothetical protein